MVVVELYQLRSFVVVAELGHLTRAAERLHLSQPALSGQIKALEQTLGLALFERRSSGMALTPAGTRLLDGARGLLAGAQALQDEALAIRGEIAGVLRVGTVSDPEFIRVGELMGAAVERHPHMVIEFHHEVSGLAFEKVRDGGLDASFYYGDLAHPSVSAVVLRDITYRIVAPAAWRARVANARWAEMAAEPWIMTPDVSTHHQLASALFREHGIAPTRVVEADDELVVGSLVVAGLGLALMREDLAFTREAAGEVCLWGDVRLSTRLQFIHLRSRAADPVVRALVELLRDLWTQRPAERRPVTRSARLRAAAETTA
jgi:DNA-binding transcriptional LysR family regulator